MYKLPMPLALVLLLTIGSLLPHPSSGAKTPSSALPSLNEDIRRNPLVNNDTPVQDQLVRSKATIDAFDSLIAKAQSEGSVRVIIGLRVDSFEPEGRLHNPDAVDVQRERIARAQNTLTARLSTFSIKSVKNFSFIPFAAMTVDAAGLEQLKISDDVVSIEEDIAVPPALAESVPLIGAPTAWAAGYTGSGQTVAILDTGVEKTHSFLAGKVVSEACYSTDSSNPLSFSVCPGGVANSTSPGSGVNCSTSINGCNHGTHVAGIAAGKGNSFSGVAKDASIIAIQVFSRFDNPNDCKGTAPCALTYSSDQMSGLERIYALRSTFNIAAVNMSLGGGRNFSNCDLDPRKAAIDNLRSVGIATVISSGNEFRKDSMGSPACISSAISVGATGDGSGSTPLDTVASFSNSASFLSLLAPGDVIRSSVPGGGFLNLPGTSMAAPHVAGAWAVLKSKKPTATVDEVFAALRDTGIPVTDTNGITKPRIKLDAAINAIGGGGSCATTPIAIGQTINGTLATTDCRYPLGSNWYSDAHSFNGTAGQQVAISMSSSSFDTWLALISPTGTELVIDNDGGGGTNSRIPATSGFYTLPSSGTFKIQASSNLENATGNYTISLSAPPTGVPNNSFASAQIISGNAGSVTGNNTGATKESGEPNHAGNTGGASVWYRWQAPASASVTINTAGSNFDSLLAVYTGSNVNALTTIVSNDDVGPSDLTSRVTFNAVSGTIYRIAVDGYNGATGNIVLNWSGGPAGPANNNFAGAQTISGNAGSVSGNNSNASKEAGEPNHAGDSGGVSVWYQWQAPATGSATITTAGSNFDTLLAIYTGSTVSSLTTVVSNDDESFPSVLTSRVTFTAVAGTTYRLAVDGFNGGVGNIVLNWSQSVPPSPPTANAATNVTGNSFTSNWNSSNTATGYRLDVSASNSFGSFVSGYNNLDVGNVLSRSVTGLSAGTTYYYRVRAYNANGTSGNSGTIVVTTAANPPSPPIANVATNVTGSSFTSNWSSAGTASGYRLDVSTNNSFSSFVSGYNNLDVGNVLSRNVTGLSAGTTYYYRVRAYNANGTSGNSNVIAVTTNPPPPMIFIELGTTNRAAALDSVTLLRGPFRVLNNFNFHPDRHTRVIIFTSNLGLTLPDPSILSVRAAGLGLTVEGVGPVSGVTGMNASYIVVRLPDGLPSGDLPLTVTLRGVASSNSPTLSISQ